MNIQKQAFEKAFKQTEIYKREVKIRKKDILEYSTKFGYFSIVANDAWKMWQQAQKVALPEETESLKGFEFDGVAPVINYYQPDYNRKDIRQGDLVVRKDGSEKHIYLVNTIVKNDLFGGDSINLVPLNTESEHLISSCTDLFRRAYLSELKVMKCLTGGRLDNFLFNSTRERFLKAQESSHD